jgi:hypothetical protein
MHGLISCMNVGYLLIKYRQPLGLTLMIMDRSVVARPVFQFIMKNYISYHWCTFFTPSRPTTATWNKDKCREIYFISFQQYTCKQIKKLKTSVYSVDIFPAMNIWTKNLFKRCYSQYSITKKKKKKSTDSKIDYWNFTLANYAHNQCLIFFKRN